MIVLDASVLIAYLTTDDVFHPLARDLLQDFARRGEVLLVNPVTLAEVLVAPTRAGRADDAVAALTEVGVAEVSFPPDAARNLARLRGTGVKMPDCCVLLTAMDQRATLCSFDDRLVRAAAQLGVHALPM